MKTNLLTMFASAHLTTREVAYMRERIAKRRFHQKQCFCNAYSLISRRGALRYAEGRLKIQSHNGEGIWVPHAWVVLHGKVIDPTARLWDHERGVLQRVGLPIWRDRVAGVIPPTRIYLGQTFSFRGISNHLQRERCFGNPILDDDLFKQWIADGTNLVAYLTGC